LVDVGIPVLFVVAVSAVFLVDVGIPVLLVVTVSPLFLVDVGILVLLVVAVIPLLSVILAVVVVDSGETKNTIISMVDHNLFKTNYSSFRIKDYYEVFILLFGFTLC
jgi:hypothetical protein